MIIKNEDIIQTLLNDPEMYSKLFQKKVKHEFAIYSANQKIIEAGKIYNHFFMIRKGIVRVVVDRGEENIGIGQIHTIIAELSDNDIFGEFGMFDGTPATADVISVNQTEIVMIENQSFLELVHSDPELGFKISLQMLRTLIERVKKLNTTVSNILYYSINKNAGNKK